MGELSRDKSWKLLLLPRAKAPSEELRREQKKELRRRRALRALRELEREQSDVDDVWERSLERRERSDCCCDLRHLEREDGGVREFQEGLESLNCHGSSQGV